MMRATLDPLLARRIGRIAFGAVLVAGALYLVTLALDDERVPRIGLHGVVLAIWALAALTATAARWLARCLRIRRPPDAWFAASLMVPTVGIALVLPITIHMPIALLVGGADGFRFWLMVSAGITGPAHLVFAIASARRAHQLVAGRPAWSAQRIYNATVITSCVPFVLLLGIPPLLVGVTAALFVPLLERMEGLVAAERAAMTDLPGALPRARALPAGRIVGADPRVI